MVRDQYLRGAVPLISLIHLKALGYIPTGLFIVPTTSWMGAPTTNVAPGAGSYPHDLAMSRWYMGLRTTWPLDNPGSGARVTGMRYRPLEYKGTDGQGVFSGTWGRH